VIAISSHTPACSRLRACTAPTSTTNRLCCLWCIQVEPIALLANAPETGFVGVYMYCDDQANLKHLPPNMRATQIAAEAGQALQVRGKPPLLQHMACSRGMSRVLAHVQILAAIPTQCCVLVLQLDQQGGAEGGIRNSTRTYHLEGGL
jgi:hypothetical protein